LPGTERGTAEDPPGSPLPDGATESSSAPDGSASPAPHRNAGSAAGGRSPADAGGVEPRTNVAWAAGGSLRGDTIATLQAEGVDRVVLGAGGLCTGHEEGRPR